MSLREILSKRRSKQAAVSSSSSSANQSCSTAESGGGVKRETAVAVGDSHTSSTMGKVDNFFNDGSYNDNKNNGNNGNNTIYSQTFSAVYYGSIMLDRKYTPAMLPWMVAEVKRRGHQGQPVYLEIKGQLLISICANSNVTWLEHKLNTIYRFLQLSHNRKCFAYLVKDTKDSAVQNCYVFQAQDEYTVQDLFSVMREATRDIPNSLTSSSGLNGSDKVSEGNSAQRYELIYVGKIRASHRKPPATFIDEAVDKFRALELEKLSHQPQTGVGVEQRQRHGSGTSITSLPPNLEPFVSIRENELEEQVDGLSECVDDSGSGELASCLSSDSVNYTAQPKSVQIRKQDRSQDDRYRVNFNNNEVEKHVKLPESKWQNSDSSVSSFSSSSASETVPSVNSNRTARNRAQSLGNEIKRGRSGSMSGQNRTMVFQIGKTDVSLISLDKKSVIFHKLFKDILHCSQGIKYPEHFGFICPDASSENFLGYILRCQSEVVTEEILTTLKQVFTSTAAQQRKSLRNQFLMCETCPMLWLHKLCLDLEGLPASRAHQIIIRRLDSLTIDEKNEILAKLQGAEAVSTQEQNEIIMMLLRALCETKQSKHNHIDVHGKLESAGGGIFDRKGQPSVLDDLRKARKSLTSSFENIMKRKTKDDARNAFRERSSTIDADMTVHDSSRCSTPESSPAMTPDRKGGFMDDIGDDDSFRKRSSTNGGLRDARRTEYPNSKLGKQKSSPMMNIFMKVGNPSKLPDEEGMTTPPSKGSWRQAIFNRVVTPQRNPPIIALNTFSLKTSESPNVPSLQLQTKRSPAALRTLWRKAILQQIILIRMEKENNKLKANQDAANVKRIKLSYEEITPCLKEVTKVWEEMLISLNPANRPEDEPTPRVEFQKLADAVSAGVPRQWRGDIWCLLAEQHSLVSGSASATFPDVNLDATYDELLKQLTAQQHAILIDLGRTFPNHPYFTAPLGPGQLSLFNLLKAYSLLDKEVGYCQGLSFIAGVLLLHMEEEQAFEMLKHMLFVLGVRRQFKPDMVALQIQMYQLSRLIHDQHRDLYEHFEKHEIAPTLYAAPWFLTLFASQFPLGFVARVFDLIFLYGMEVVFKVAVVLLGNHKELIVQCYSFESVMEFLKTTLPSMGIIQMERVFNQVFELEISKQLHAYEVEYHVLQEEMLSTPAQSDLQTETIDRLEQASRNLKRQNMELLEEVQMAYNNVRGLERTISSYQACNSKLESRVKTLELEKAQLKQLAEELKRKWPTEHYDRCADVLSNYLHVLRTDSPPPSNPIPYQTSSFVSHSVSTATVLRSSSPTSIANGSAICDRSQSQSYGNPFRRRRNLSGDSVESQGSYGSDRDRDQ